MAQYYYNPTWIQCTSALYVKYGCVNILYVLKALRGYLYRELNAVQLQHGSSAVYSFYAFLHSLLDGSAPIPRNHRWLCDIVPTLKFLGKLLLSQYKHYLFPFFFWLEWYILRKMPRRTAETSGMPVFCCWATSICISPIFSLSETNTPLLGKLLKLGFLWVETEGHPNGCIFLLCWVPAIQKR